MVSLPCVLALQMKMAAYIRNAFGDALVADFINGDPCPKQLPSPKVSFGFLAVHTRAHIR